MTRVRKNLYPVGMIFFKKQKSVPSNQAKSLQEPLHHRVLTAEGWKRRSIQVQTEARSKKNLSKDV